MVVAVETVVVQALNVATGVPVPVAIPIFVKEDVEVTYGIDGLSTVQNVDYTITQLDEQNFDTFILTPMAALLTKINNLIAANPDEINAIYIRRKLDYKTSSTADAVKNTPYTSKEFDRTAARFQQIQEILNRCVKLVKSVTSTDDVQVRPLTPDRVPVVSADGNYLEDGPLVTVVEAAQEYGQLAIDSAAAAAVSEANAEADKVQTGLDRAAVATDKGIVAADKGIVAADKATVATDKGIVAADKAIVAADKATVNTDKGIVATDKATVAAALIATQAARDATLAAFDSFDDRYLGAKAADPTLDNDGDPLSPGLIYFNTVATVMKVYTGTLWVAAYVSGTDFAALANNGSDYNAASFRTNLSLYSIADIDGFTVKLTGNQTIAGTKTFSTAPAVPDGSFAMSKLSGFNTAADARIAAAVGVSVQAYDAQLFSNIPQNSKSVAYTLVASDAQKHILHPSADTTARVFTIPANASVPYAIGTAITFVNQNAAGVVTIAITTDTMRLAGAGTTGSRTLAANGIATALKVTATEWIISGTGLT